MQSYWIEKDPLVILVIKLDFPDLSGPNTAYRNVKKENGQVKESPTVIQTETALQGQLDSKKIKI